jgi:hypothetical protein
MFWIMLSELKDKQKGIQRPCVYTLQRNPEGCLKIKGESIGNPKRVKGNRNEPKEEAASRSSGYAINLAID